MCGGGGFEYKVAKGRGKEKRDIGREQRKKIKMKNYGGVMSNSVSESI